VAFIPSPVLRDALFGVEDPQSDPSGAVTQPVFRFAPSPNGDLHLGHALSAMLNHDAARASGGRFLVRIEDIDGDRSRPEFVARILEDLRWLGLDFEVPVRRQSDHVAEYRAALDRLAAMGLVYPAFASRAEIRRAVAEREAATGRPHPRDPDGAPLDTGIDRARDPAEAARRIAAGEPHALRLKMDEAAARAGPLTWEESGDFGPTGLVPADPRAWGDVVLARKDAPASYHVAVVVDDAAQGVTDVIRGGDLFQATSVHRLLQALLGLPAPRYRHHRLVLGADGRKLSKSDGSTSLRSLRATGATPADIRRLVGLAP
jgi:glutamyl-Q tRNA(Asp) synthetase